MAKNKTGSTVAPKERINITYQPAVGNAKENIELPFKVTVLGDFTQQADERTVEDRAPVSVNSTNLDEVIAEQNLTLQFSVKNEMVDDSDDPIDVNLDIKSLKDFSPDALINAVPALKETFQIREALQALKGPLGNNPGMRKAIHAMLSDKGTRDALMAEITQH